jgi:hypothetical protein
LVQQLRDDPHPLFGQTVQLPCRFVTRYEEAIGFAGSRFEIDGQSHEVSAEQESLYRRLMLVCPAGQELPPAYIAVDGSACEALPWLVPGDLIEVVATPAMRVTDDRPRVHWSLMIQQILPLSDSAYRAVQAQPSADLRLAPLWQRIQELNPHERATLEDKLLHNAR